MIPIKIKKTGGVALTDDMRALIEDKLSKLKKFISDDDTTALAEVEVEQLTEKRGGFRVEVNFSSKGEVVRVEAKRPTMQIALDAVMEDLLRRLRRKKTKNVDFARQGARAVKDFFQRFRGS